MKRIICILLIAMISMPVILGVQAQAIDVDKKESEVVPSYVGLNSMSPALGISSSGKASCTVDGRIRAGYTGKLSWELQYQSGTSWTQVKTWSNAVAATFNLRENRYVNRVYTYILKAVISIFNSAGTKVETITAYSKSVKF